MPNKNYMQRMEKKMFKQKPYLKYCYKKSDNTLRRDKVFREAISLIKLMLNANRQVVYLLTKYDYSTIAKAKTRRIVIKTNTKSILENAVNTFFLDSILKELYTCISGEKYKRHRLIKTSLDIKKSKTIIDEKDLVALANLFDLIRKYSENIAISTNKYLKLNTKPYNSLKKLRTKFNRVKWGLDRINCLSDEIFNKYNFMFSSLNL